MKANTFIRFKNESPKRVKEQIHVISSQISMNLSKSFPFISCLRFLYEGLARF